MSDVLEIDPMDTVEFEVEQRVETLANAMKDIADWRLNNVRRQILLSHPCRMRLVLALDALKVTTDDLGITP